MKLTSTGLCDHRIDFDWPSQATNVGRALSLGRCIATLNSAPVWPDSLSLRERKTVLSLCCDIIYVRIISTRVLEAVMRALAWRALPRLFHTASPRHRRSANDNSSGQFGPLVPGTNWI